MNCPPGQVYDERAKRCIRRDALPLSKGHSQEPCPEGQVWNPLPGSRRCVRKNSYEQLFGPTKARAASAEQKRLRNTRKAVKPTAPPPSPPPAAGPRSPPKVIAPRRVGVSPAAVVDDTLNIGEPRVLGAMPPGLNRADMIAWIEKHCHNKEDPVSLEDYADSDIGDLRSLVRLGSGFCYPVDTLDAHIRSSIERDVPIKDIMNPEYRLDARDYGAIVAQGKAKRKTYSLPSRSIELPASHYKLYIGPSNDVKFNYIFLYNETKVKKLPDRRVDYTQAIPDGGWLGFLPVAGTDELIRLIRRAYRAGRLFTKATRPFECCRVHVKKSKEFWSSDTASKISSLEEELRGVL